MFKYSKQKEEEFKTLVKKTIQEEMWYPERHVSEIDTLVAQKLNVILASIIIKINNL